MFKAYWIGVLLLVSSGCASFPEEWDVQASSCVSAETIVFSGLGADVEISPSGRFVAAGDRLIDLDNSAGDGRIHKLHSYERSVFSTEDVLVTTSGASFIRYRWNGGWAERERFALGDSISDALFLRSVGPYDLQREDEATRLVGFSAPSGENGASRLVSGAFGAAMASAQSTIAFAQGYEVMASNAFVLVDASVFPDEMERVRARHLVLRERPSSVCVSGFVSCNRYATAVRALIALDPDLNPLETHTAAMSGLARHGLSDIHSVNRRGDILASTRQAGGEGGSVVFLGADGTATPLFAYSGFRFSPHAALGDSGRAVMLFTSGHDGEKRPVVADINAGCRD